MANGLERRDFLKVLGTAGAGVALSACSNSLGGVPPERLIPYVVPQDDIVPGIATYYRTTCRECPAGCGMDIATREGRAIKAEGNPLSPMSQGKLCPRGQASLQGLYNPDRVRQALVRSGADWQKLTWDDAEQRVANALAGARGRAVFLTRNYTGTLDRLATDWSSAAGVERIIYDAYAWEPIRAAHRMLFGVEAVPVHDFSRASVVVNFGADFLETWVSPVDYARGFVQGTAYTNGQRGKLWAFTAHQTLTDMNAEEWVPIRPGTEHLVALAMAKLIVGSGRGQAGAAAGLLNGVDVNAVAQQAGVPVARIQQAAQEFANGGRSLAVGPGISAQHRAATAVAAAVAILNSVAGNYGSTVSLSRTEEHSARVASYADMQRLVQRMQAGQVQVLLVDGPNPLYTMPGAEVAAALARVPFIASFSSYLDETSAKAHVLLPDHHFLESWGDYVPRTGVRSVVQPVMMPVFDTKQTGDVLLSVATRLKLSLPNTAAPAGAATPAAPGAQAAVTPPATYYDYLRATWQREVMPSVGGAGTFEDWWQGALKSGVVLTPAATAPAGAAPALNAAGLGQLRFEVAEFTGTSGSDQFYLIAYPSIRFYDGRTANRPWLQELPDPVSKVSWESWLELSPATARRLGIEDGHVVEITTPFGKTRLPVWRHPGIRDDTVAIQIGQGHEELGRYAAGRGVNVVKLLGAVAEPVSGAMVWAQVKAAVQPTGEWVRVPGHMPENNGEAGREIARSISLAEARRVEGVAAAGVAAVPHAAGAEAQGGEHAEIAGNPKNKVVTELQGTGGFAPETMTAGPAGYPPPSTYYGEYSHSHPRWAMAIDMERCIGCSACVTACYAENNIGIVGPEQAAKGRLLTWLRIERYFEGGDQKSGEGFDHVNFLPMLCQQCGNAPCEPVCPVYAAYHTPEGLNGQIYNRCVGTRYCANNCPYKVRYFNWFSWEWPEPLNWQLNPDVTVREKGVMEKCTFCVQRIRASQNQARLEGRGTLDGEITPACAQTCPGDAIVFGNVKDPNSRVAQIAASGRGYRVLEELNTQSAITYLKRVVDASEA